MLAYLLLTALSCMCSSLLQADGLAQSGDFVKVLLIAQKCIADSAVVQIPSACLLQHASSTQQQPTTWCAGLQVPISCLQWEHRLPLILQEVREADADIICLQELNHFGT